MSRLLILPVLIGCALGCRSASTDTLDADDPALEVAEPDVERDTGAEPTADPAQAELESPDHIVLARVDGVSLTLADAMATFEGSHGGHAVLVRGEVAVRELIGRLVQNQVLLAEALALGVDREPEVLEVVEERRQKLAEGLFWEREVDQKVEVDEAEAEAFYVKTEVTLAVTLIEGAQRETCEQLRARVQAGESMAELAAGESIHSSRSAGGLLPFVRRGDLEPALDEALFALEEEGALTEVVATENGYAFARLDKRTVNEDRPSREELLPQIRQILREEGRKDLRKEVEQRVRQEAGVEIDEALTAPEVVLDSGRDLETVVARSAGQELTLGELRSYLDLDRLGAATTERAAEAVDGVVREWTDRKAVRQAARELGLLDDAEIQPEVERWRKDVILAYLYGEYMYADLEVTEEAARAYYEDHLEDVFTVPPKARVAYIVVPTREEAVVALARLEAGEEFGALARELSVDSSAEAHGGRIGWITRGDLLEEVETPVLAAEAGATVGPIDTPSGWFVVQVIERTEAIPIAFETGKARAMSAVQSQLRTEVYNKWVDRLRERADVEIDESGIQQAVAWLEVEAQRLEEEKAERAPQDSPHSSPDLPQMSAGATAPGGPLQVQVPKEEVPK